MIAPSIDYPTLSLGVRRLLAAGIAALVLVLGVLAASPRLHQWLHPDAGRPDHECVITLFSHSGIQTCTDVILVAAVIFLARTLTEPLSLALVAPSHWLPFGHAPPAR